MATKTFSAGTTIDSDWLNDVDAATYEGAASFTQGGTGAVQRTSQDKAREVVSVKDFGAVGDGVTDDTNAFSLACTYLNGKKGGVIRVVGTYLIDQNLTLPKNVTLRGEFEHPGEDVGTLTYNTSPSTIILNGAATITLGNSSAVQGIEIINKVVAAALPYDTLAKAQAGITSFAGTAITINGADALVDRALILGFNQAIFGTGRERPILHKVYFDCINGIDIEHCTDIGKMSDCHGWPFLTTHHSYNSTDWTCITRSGTAYKYANTADWNKFTNCFSYGYANGFVIDSCNNVTLIGCGTDYAGSLSSTSVGYTIQGTSQDAVLIGCQAAAQGTGMLVNTTATAGGEVRIVGSSLWANDSIHIRVQQGRAIIADTSIRAGSVGIQVDSTASNVLVDGCDFDAVPTVYSVASGSATEKFQVGRNHYYGCTDSGIGSRWLSDNQSANQNYTVYNSGGVGPAIVGNSARGNTGSPTVSAINDQCLRIRARFWDGTQWGTGSLIRTNAEAAATTGSTPGRLIFSTTASGSVSETDRLILDASGNFWPVASSTYSFGLSANRWNQAYINDIVLKPSASVTPASNGDVQFQKTSDTQLTIKMKGSDGTVRSVSLTLA